MRRLTSILVACAAAVAALSCSTTRTLPEGTYRLARNKIVVDDKKQFSPSGLEPYLKQKSNTYLVFGWNPFLNVYNWSSGKGTGWDRFVQKLGVAPVQFDPSLVESTKDNMEAHLRYMGFYGSTVTDSISYKKRKANVTYSVHLGKRFPIKDIRLDFEDSTLLALARQDSIKSLLKRGDFLSENTLEAESQRLNTIFKQNGYYGFSKNYIFFEADTTLIRDSALLTVRVKDYTRNETPADGRPHRQYSFRNVTIEHPKDMKIRPQVLMSLNRIRPGDLYDERVVNQTYSRFSSVRLFSSVNVNLNEAAADSIDCSIALTKSKIQGMKVNMEVSSNSSGLIGMSPSVSYYNKNIFRGGEWFTLSFMGNFQFKFNDPIRSNELGVSAGLSFPKFVFLPDRLFSGTVPRTDLNLSYNYQSRPEYTRNMISTSFSYNWNNSNGFYYSVSPLQLNIIRLFDIDPGFYEDLSNNPFMLSAYQNHFDLGLGGTIYYTTDNSVIPRQSYFYARLQADLAGNLLSAFNGLMPVDQSGSHTIWNTPYSQFVRAELTLGKTWFLGKGGGHSIATRIMAGIGYSYGNSTALPFEKQFYAGGSSSMRGWSSRSLGPGMSVPNMNFVIPNQTGDFKFEANIEYRFKMFWKIAGAVFADAGNVWNLRATSPNDPGQLRADTFFKSIAFDWGAGIRLDLDFVLLRLDMGLKTYDPSRLTLRQASIPVTGISNAPALQLPQRSGWLSPGEWFRNGNFTVHFGVGYPF